MRPSALRAAATLGHAQSIALVGPPFFTAALAWRLCALLFFAGAGLLGYFEAHPGEVDDPSTFRGPAILAAALVVGILLLARAFGRPRTLPPIVLHAGGVDLPVSPESPRRVYVPCPEILSAYVGGLLPGGQLLVGTRDRTFAVPRRMFADPRDCDRFPDEVRTRLAHLPGGAPLAAEMEERGRVARAAYARRPVATLGLIAALGLAYLGQGLEPSQPFQSILHLVRLGGNAPILVREGELYRLVTANFLHANLTHVALNALALLVLGWLVERLLGRARFLLVYLGAAVGGALASTLWDSALVSVGASTAIYGLFGALLWLHVRFRHDLPAGFRIPFSRWMVVLGLEAAVPFFSPEIDVAAHLGGLVSGVVLTALVTKGRRLWDILDDEDQGRSLLAAAAVLAGMLVILNGSARDRAESERIFADRLAEKSESAFVLNEVAWLMAGDPGASRERLTLAREASERAVAQEPGNPSFQDTQATVYHRLGVHDLAVDVEREVLRARDDRFTASQLARFLLARTAADGPLVENDGEEPYEAELLVEPFAGPAGERTIVLHLDRSPPRGMVLFALALSGETLVGSLWIAFAPEPATTHRFIVPATAGPPGAKTELRVALLDARGADKDGWRYWSYDPDVAALPGPAAPTPAPSARP